MLVKVAVESVRINLATNTRIVLLKDVKIERYLMIHIGEFESLAIAGELQGQKNARPLTHDLLNNVLERLGTRVVSIVVHTLQSDVFFASINLERGEEAIEIDARPSDAIALAVRCAAPIFVEEQVFEQAGLRVPTKTEEDDRLSVFRDFVNQLDF